MFVIILAFIFVFACVGVHLFMDVYNKVIETKQTNNITGAQCCIDVTEEETYIGAFDHIAIAMLRLFVLLSTENYPGIMLPAYRSERLNFFYFGIFVFVGVFFLTAILLAIIVEGYWLDAKKYVKKNRARERTELAKAWNLMDPCGLGAIDVDHTKFFHLFRILKPKNSDEQNQILIELLDSNLDGFIDSFEWTTSLRQTLEAEFEANDEDFDSEDVENGKYTQLHATCKAIVESNVFSRLILLLIFLHVAMFTLKWKGQSRMVVLIVQGFRTIIIILFMVESLLKFFGLGKRLLMQVLEAIDFILVFVATVFNFLCYGYAGTIYYDYFTIISSLSVFMRLFLNSAQTRNALRWFLNIAPVMVDLVILLIISMYLLAVIGMELFHDIPVVIEMKKMTYSSKCGLGFNTFSCSLLNLFQMLSTSNWHDIMNLVYNHTKQSWTAIYFVFVYIVITMVIMNLFVAIAIEAANKLGDSNTEYQLSNKYSKSQKQSFKTKAATAFQSFANSFFGTARAEDRSQRLQLSTNATVTGVKRKRMSSATIILQPPHGRKTSRISLLKNSTINTDMKKDEEKHVEDLEEDFSRLSAKERRERKLKRRVKERRQKHMKKRIEEEISIAKEIEREELESTNNAAIALEHAHSQCQVIAAFKAAHSEQLDVTPGDTVNVLKHIDDWIHGELSGKIGWIPASHVVMLRNRVLNGIESSNFNTNQVLVPVFQFPDGMNEQVDTNNGKVLTPSSPRQHKFKMKKAGDWTRNILGDITVMNAEEMRELNKVMRAEMKAPLKANRKNPSPSAALQRELSTVSEDSLFADADIHKKTAWNVKQPQPTTNKSDLSNASKDHMLSPTKKSFPVTVSIDRVKTPPPSSPDSIHEDLFQRLNSRNKVKKIQVNEDGTPPEWIKKFASSKHLNLDDDLKMTDDVDSSKSLHLETLDLSTTSCAMREITPDGNGTALVESERSFDVLEEQPIETMNTFKKEKPIYSLDESNSLTDEPNFCFENGKILTKKVECERTDSPVRSNKASFSDARKVNPLRTVRPSASEKQEVSPVKTVKTSGDAEQEVSPVRAVRTSILQNRNSVSPIESKNDVEVTNSPIPRFGANNNV